MVDALGTRMKMYEQMGSGRCLPLLPVIARLDGRSFSKFTKDLDKPYDTRLVGLMQDTTRYLVEETAACIGYTQSDEITLVFYSSNHKTQIFFDGKIQKMASTLAAITSVYFNYKLENYLPEKKSKLATFDCRVFQVPNPVEGVNAIQWRELNATKNSIQSAARTVYSHKETLGKNTSELQEMLFQKGINWNEYPAFFKRGSYYQRRKVVRKFSAGEIKILPKKHAYRTNPDLEVERTDVVKVEMPPLAKIWNRLGVIFRGQEPKIEKEE